MSLVPERIAAGREALNAPLERLDGRSDKLASYLADPLIVFAWASW